MLFLAVLLSAVIANRRPNFNELPAIRSIPRAIVTYEYNSDAGCRYLLDLFVSMNLDRCTGHGNWNTLTRAITSRSAELCTSTSLPCFAEATYGCRVNDDYRGCFRSFLQHQLSQQYAFKCPYGSGTSAYIMTTQNGRRYVICLPLNTKTYPPKAVQVRVEYVAAKHAQIEDVGRSFTCLDITSS